MKRWQDRGVVEDSEDDEISLGAASPSPEPPRKRTKHDQDDVVPDQQDNSVQNSTDERNVAAHETEQDPWIGPKVAITYGQKTKTKAQSRPRTPGAAANSGHASPRVLISVGDRSGERPPATQHFVFAEPESSLDSDSDGLPDLAPILRRSGNEARERILSAASSPLSEREVSPLAVFPPAFEAAPRPERTEPEKTLHDNTAIEQIELEELDGYVPTSTAVAKRNFRARKPNQLNPYQYDRALYLQQCKARGVQPIRLIEQENDEEESQSQSQDSATQSQGGLLFSSSPVKAQGTDARDNFDLSPEGADRNATSRHRLPKRRKLEHRAESTMSDMRQRQSQDLSVPPSPPRTGSDASTTEEAPTEFRMPPRITPVPLPTPQISSDLKRMRADSGSPSDSSPRRPRTSTLNRSRRKVPVVTVSSDSEPESDLEAKRLRREQKRIRGVLPASWLKIDFRAQKPREVPAANTRQRSPSTSPERRMPQKGVAQKVARRSTRIDESDFPVLSGAESSSDSSNKSLARLKQRKLDTASTQLAFARQSTFDDDVMENDFVDPMLSGPSRRRSEKKNSGHQPRITQAFKTSAPSTTNFSEERVAHTRPGQRHRGSENTARQRRRISRPPPVQLSITDAFDEAETEEARLPSFVKLALRQTRHRRDQGRHSPTHKVIRLATTDETEDASSTLRAWREGTIVPRVKRRPRHPPDNGYTPHQGPAVRAALAEISGNERSQVSDESLDQRAGRSHTRKLTRRNGVSAVPSAPRDIPAAGEDEEAITKTKAKRQLHSGLRPLRLRDAQLESLEDSFDQDHRSAVFERRMQCLTEHVARRTQRHVTSGFHLDRYLHTGEPSLAFAQQPTEQVHNSSEDISAPHDTGQTVAIPYRPRKRQARRLNVEARKYRQPSEPLPDTAFTVEEENESHETPEPVLQDLGPFGTRYPSTFDIRPVPAGTFFDRSTFVGSGELHDALNLRDHTLDEQRGCMRVHLEAEVLSWGVWQDEVAVHFSRIAASVGNNLRDLEGVLNRGEGKASCHEIIERISYLLRSVVRYLARCISFSDPIDRLACVERLCQLVTGLSEILVEHQATAHMRTAVTRVLQYSTVLAKQALQLSDHSAVPTTTKTEARTLLRKVAERLADHAIKGRLDELSTAYEDSHKLHSREAGFNDDLPALNSVVILRNALQGTCGSSADFWMILNTVLRPQNTVTCSVKHLETAWYDLFSILPALAFDSRGLARNEYFSTDVTTAWDIPQLLLKRVFDLYEASSAVRCASVNDYVRVQLSRCHCLVTTWGFRQSDLALSTVYDFFAQRNLHLLNNEDSRGSPSFLEDFGTDGFLYLQPDDRSFHIFLKMLAASLKGIQAQGAPLRKIQSIVFRLTPNHARTYRKDATLIKADLEALRNHYDLLCTLYCAAPAGGRPSVYLLQNLIDHSSSHREACRASVRSWAHVAVFQAASDEPAEALHSLIDWYSDMVRTTMTQYRLAKSEAERDFEVAQSEAHEAGSDMPPGILESTIANNQMQIAATLVDGLAGLKRALQSARNSQTAKTLVEGTGFMSILELFDPAQRRLLNTMIEALAVVNAALDAESRPTSIISQQEGSEDSQEFGDLDALQAFAEDDYALDRDEKEIAGTLEDPVGHFLSNVFGADAAADDTLLMKTVDTWTRIAGSTSISHNRSWHSYVDEYSPTSWYQMRDTSHKRKYTPYFLSRLVEQSNGSEDIKQAVLSTWLLSLVEREATLKFQHSLTSTILDHWSYEPLLSNLPFASDSDSGRYHITLSQLRARRVALVSSILCNMREHYENTIRLSRSRSSELRSTYTVMLRQLMNAMKSHYQELQTSCNAEVADASVTGTYVEFVQQVVASLQQYTLDICPVDRFFLDSTAFPLPAGDPTYVVGRLRSYAPKLKESQGRAQLAAFIQSVIERAMIDGQQDYLIDQMSTAMIGANMASRQIPTLWQVTAQCVLPVYIHCSLETESTWIAAMPLLQAWSKAAPELLYNIDVRDDDTTRVATTTLSCVLHSIGQQLAKVLIQTSFLNSAHALKVLTAVVMACQALITFIAFLERSTEGGQGLAAYLRVARDQIATLRKHLISTEADHPTDLPGELAAPVCVWQDTSNFTEKQLRETIGTNWYSENGRHFVRRGNTSKELQVQLESATNEREGLLQATDSFLQTYDATFDPHCRQRQARRACDDILGGLHI